MSEVQSSILSRIRRIFALDIKIEGSLKVKRCTLVTTSCEASSNGKEKSEDGQASSYPIIVLETDDLEDDTELAGAPETSKNVEGFQHGSANGKILK